MTEAELLALCKKVANLWEKPNDENAPVDVKADAIASAMRLGIQAATVIPRLVAAKSDAMRMLGAAKFHLRDVSSPGIRGLCEDIDAFRNGPAMTRDKYDALPSDGKHTCPDCGYRNTTPHADCGCPTVSQMNGVEFTFHINKWHHVCPDAVRA